MDRDTGAWSVSERVARGKATLPGTLRDEGGFTLIELLVVVTIIGVLAAIAIPTYVGQQDKAKDAAAQAQLRTAATAQQLYYADEDAYAADMSDLAGVYGFRQGEPRVEIEPGAGASYCMYAPAGGGKTFSITPDSGSPREALC